MQHDSSQSFLIENNQLGGNGPFKKFMKSYQNGGYTDGMNPHDTYHSWAATQYREKVRHLKCTRYAPF